jgi:hypothetical protein
MNNTQNSNSMTEKKQKIADKDLNSSPYPTSEESVENIIVLKNGIELCLNKDTQQDPNIVKVRAFHIEYPGHLILIQSGEFLHAYNKCAYFLHRVKNYKMTLMGSGSKAHLRVGFPLKNSKRRLWKIMSDFRVPYIVLLGTIAKGYQIYSSEKELEQQSLLLEISNDIVMQTIDELRQTNNLSHTSTARLLLNKDVSFRLKHVAQEQYHNIIKDIAKYPRNHRHGLGKDMHYVVSEMLKLIFNYSASSNRYQLLSELSGVID